MKAVVQIGIRGLVETVMEQMEAQLEIHELIKVKLGPECPIAPAEVAEALLAKARAEVVQTVGRTLVVYRPRKKDPEIRLPSPSPAPKAPPGI